MTFCLGKSVQHQANHKELKHKRNICLHVNTITAYKAQSDRVKKIEVLRALCILFVAIVFPVG